MKKFLLVSSVFVFFANVSIAHAKKNIVVIGTGGTIAGVSKSENDAKYAPSSIGIQDVIKSVPKLSELADIEGEQLFQISSQDMNEEAWLKIARKTQELVDKREVDGVVITHGTDTLEETAYFLNLVIKTEKPVVVVGSMRPATSTSCDGALNLYNAVAVAASSEAKRKGVLVVFNDNILTARDVSKIHTTNVDAFVSNNFGPIGSVYYGKVKIYFEPLRTHTNRSVFDISAIKSLPKVDIIYGYANPEASIIDQLITAKTRGIVLAGVGDGNIAKESLQKLISASKAGIKVVRSSRLGSGFVMRNTEVEDDEYDFITADNLNPQKARILLMLSLTKTDDSKKIQNLFWSY